MGELHKVSTLDTNTNIKRMITELNDPNLLVKIVGTDLIAKGIRYHLKCLVELRNRYRSCNANLKELCHDILSHFLRLAKLLSV